MTRQEEPYKTVCFFDKKSSLLADLKRGFAQISFLFAALHVRQPDRLSVKFRPSFFCTVQCSIFKSKCYNEYFLAEKLYSNGHKHFFNLKFSINYLFCPNYDNRSGDSLS